VKLFILKLVMSLYIHIKGKFNSPSIKVSIFSWVEQDSNSLFKNVLQCMHQLFSEKGSGTKVAIVNQRETIIAVERSSGLPLYNAISWMDIRTSGLCEEYSKMTGSLDTEKLTGLKFSPFFSVFKMIWLLENVDQVKVAASKDDLVFCTVDCWILMVMFLLLTDCSYI
jgi:glycerol kinase